MNFKPISQRKWTRGLQATFSIFAEPEAILKRLSNMVYTRRGGLETVDGSLIFTKQNGFLQVAAPPILDAILYSPTTAKRYYMGIQVGALAPLPVVTGLTATPLTLGGSILSMVRVNGVVTITLDSTDLIPDALNPPYTSNNFITALIALSGLTNFVNGNYDLNTWTLISSTPTTATYQFNFPGSDATDTGSWAPTFPIPNGTYTFGVTASDFYAGETTVSAPAVAVLTGSQNAIKLTWNPVVSAAGYQLYVTAATSGFTGRVNGITLLFPIPTSNTLDGGPGLVYVGIINGHGQTPTIVNTTAAPGPCIVWKFDAPSYTVQLGALPPTAVISVPPPPGGGTGSGSGGGTQNPAATTQGGVLGQSSPTPQMVPFRNSIMIAAGNGTPPLYYADGQPVQPLPNNFTAIYPDWQPSVVQNVGDNIVDSVSGGVFACVQGGTTGTTRPAPFNNTLKAGTADNTVVWQCIATNYQGQPLRGAAHAIVYAGFLWLANTYPTTTDDQQDGPSCIKSSDLNSFQSWNPVNVAMVNPDDGDQITGLAQFTIAELGITPTGSLVVFKSFSTYQVTGVFGGSDFSIQQSKSDMGCIASRSIQFLSGFGQIARLTHLGFAMFDGTNDKVFSEEIRPYLFGDVNQPDIAPVDWSYIYFSKAAQSSNPPMYLCACPILTPTLAGVTVADGPFSLHRIAVFVKVTKVVNGVEVSITPESQVLAPSSGPEFVVTTPAAQPGVSYNVYAGLVSGGQNIVTSAASFTATTILLSAMTPGIPSLNSGALTRIFAYDLVQKNWTIVDLPFPISALKQIRTSGTQPLTICCDWSDAALRRMFAGDPTWDGVDVIFSMTGGEIYQQGGSGKIFYRRVVVRGNSQTNVAIQVGANIQGKSGAVLTAAKTQLGPSQWDARVDIMRDGENANITISGRGRTTIDSVDWYVKSKPAGAPVSAQK